MEDLFEEDEEPAFAFAGGGVEAGVAFVDGGYTEGDGAAEGQTGDYGEDFELRVAEEPDVFGEV